MLNHYNISAITLVILLVGCATTANIGPQYQSDSANPIPQNSDPFDVSIAVFDPGLSDQNSYGEKGVWPELRRAESMYMAVQLRDILAKSKAYGAVRVTPDLSSSSDIYIKAKITQSNGEKVSLQVQVIDSSGKQWISKKYSHTVKPIAFNNPRNKDANGDLKIDPYKEIYQKINSDILKYMNRRVKPKQADMINTVTDIRFAQNFSPKAYSDLLIKDSRNKYQLKGKPDRDDPMMLRINNIQLRDQMFIDTMQTHYDGFSSDMTSSYKVWQEQSFGEAVARRKAASAAFWNGVASVVAVAATVSAANDCDSYECARNTGIVGGAVAGNFLQNSFENSQEAKIHRDALNEIAASIDGTLAPSVIEMEDNTVTLTGSATEQSNQWKVILQNIYDAETEQTKAIL
jgi:hypothetical protein